MLEAAHSSREEADLPPQLPERKQPTRVWLAIGGAVILACGALLFFFNPGQYAFYPRCAFFQLTGWQCPGCGGLRAVHQLLHGNVAAALQLNALAVLGLPLAAAWLWRQHTLGKLRTFWLWVLAGGLLIFGVVRNLPGSGWLSP